MAFPATKAEMIARGYVLKNGNATCKGCLAAIEFWDTPNGHLMPMDPMPGDSSPAVTHYATCPDANSFRKKK